MGAYQTKNASKTVDVVNLGPAQVQQAAPTASATTVIGNQAIYGVGSIGYTIGTVVKISGGCTSVANCKIRALVNGSLAKEITYESDGLKSEMFFNAPAEATITFEVSTNAAGAEVITVEPLRIVVQAGDHISNNCTC